MELKKQIERQQVQFELLANQASSLIQGRRSRVGATSAINGQLIVLDEKLSASNREVLFIFIELYFLHLTLWFN